MTNSSRGLITDWSIQDLTALLARYRYRVGSETEFQEGLARVLRIHAIDYAREHDLGSAFGRIDFYLPGRGTGIELKVKGSPSQVMRQLFRYAQSPDIQALVLVSPRSRLMFAPTEINGKPLLTVSLWQGQF